MAELAEQIAAVLGKLDTDGSGSIPDATFVALMGRLRAGSREPIDLLAGLPSWVRRPDSRLDIRALVEHLFQTPKSQLQRWAAQARSDVERGRAAKPTALAQCSQAASVPWQVAAGFFRDWLGALDVAGAVAGCVEQHLCGTQGAGFMAAFVRLTREHGSKEALVELLRECGALDVLADCIWQGTDAAAVASATLTEDGATKRRRAAAAQLQEELCQEVRAAVAEPGGEWRAAAGALFPEGDVAAPLWEGAVAELHKSMDACMAEVVDKEEVVPSRPGAAGDDGEQHFLQAVRRSVRVARSFERPTLTSVLPFLGAWATLPTELQDTARRELLQNARRWPRLQKLLEPGAVVKRGPMTGLAEERCKLLVERSPDAEEADFAGCVQLTDSVVRCLAMGCRRLLRANFAGCAALTDSAVRALAAACGGLEQARFGGCVGLTDDAVRHLADGCRGLRLADFAGCAQLTDRAAGHLRDGCAGLRHVDLSGCPALTDGAAEALAGGCQALAHVSFGGCPRLSDRAAELLAQGCRSLRHVDFAGCWLLTDAAAAFLAGGCEELSHADFSGCWRVTECAKDHLEEGLCSGSIRAVIIMEPEERQTMGQALADADNVEEMHGQICMLLDRLCARSNIPPVT